MHEGRYLYQASHTSVYAHMGIDHYGGGYTLHQKEISILDQRSAFCSLVGTKIQNIYPKPSSRCSSRPPCNLLEDFGIWCHNDSSSQALLFCSSTHCTSEVTKATSQGAVRQHLSNEGLFPCLPPAPNSILMTQKHS